MDMFALKFDDAMRRARAKGIEYKKIATLYENTPEFEAMWSAYIENDDPMYNIWTEDDGRTHTFYRIHLPEIESSADISTEETVITEAKEDALATTGG